MKESSSSTFAKINLDSSYLKKEEIFLGIRRIKIYLILKKFR